MTKKEIKATQFETLMNQVNSLYALGSKVYIDTLEGTELATVVEVNPSKFTVSCSVVLDLGNGRKQTLMLTAPDIADLMFDVNATKKQGQEPFDAYEGYNLIESCGITTISKGTEIVKEIKGTVSDAKFYVDALIMVNEVNPSAIKKKAYEDAYSDQYGANLYLSDEEKDLIQKHAN